MCGKRRTAGPTGREARAFTETFTERFERARREGELAAHAPDALAALATATLNTLAVRARTGADKADLDALIDAAVGVICAKPD